MNSRFDEAWDALASLSSEEALKVPTDYHGTQLLSGGFTEFLVDEGYLEDEDDEDDEDDEEDDDDDGED